MTLTKLPLGKWWVETDDNGEIVGTYNKAQVLADITAITNTLKSYPDPTKETLIFNSLLTTASKDSEKTDLLNKMYLAYRGDTKVMEEIQLRNKLDNLISLERNLV